MCHSKSSITSQCGWCDDPAHDEYNRLVKLPFSASHEMMWRDDGAYDLVVTLGYNDAPPEPGRGSAIFLHCIASGKAYTAGCVALARADLLVLLQHSDIDQCLNIDANLLFSFKSICSRRRRSFSLVGTIATIMPSATKPILTMIMFEIRFKHIF